MKGIRLTGKGKIIAAATALCITAGLTVVPVAGAYKVPGPPGSPGGKPTKPKGGSHTSKRLAESVAVQFAGFTGLELALRTPSETFDFPEAGSASCTASTGGSEIGSGSVSSNSTGNQTFLINLTDNGRMFLYNHNGQAISVKIDCTFAPRHGRSSSSTATVVLDT
jgi:hypothetical protein